MMFLVRSCQIYNLEGLLMNVRNDKMGRVHFAITRDLEVGDNRVLDFAFASTLIGFLVFASCLRAIPGLCALRSNDKMAESYSSPMIFTNPAGIKLAARAMRQKTANPLSHLSDFAS